MTGSSSSAVTTLTCIGASTEFGCVCRSSAPLKGSACIVEYFPEAENGVTCAPCMAQHGNITPSVIGTLLLRRVLTSLKRGLCPLHKSVMWKSVVWFKVDHAGWGVRATMQHFLQPPGRLARDLNVKLCRGPLIRACCTHMHGISITCLRSLS